MTLTLTPLDSNSNLTPLDVNPHLTPLDVNPDRDPAGYLDLSVPMGDPAKTSGTVKT